jgi:hypothetical protein
LGGAGAGTGEGLVRTRLYISRRATEGNPFAVRQVGRAPVLGRKSADRQSVGTGRDAHTRFGENRFPRFCRRLRVSIIWTCDI